MGNQCCPRPAVVMVKIGNEDVGILDLAEVLREVVALQLPEEAAVGHELLVQIRKHGNYIAASREHLYRDTLLREYRAYIRSLTREKGRGVP